MQKRKKNLKVIQGSDSPIAEGTSCFAITAKYKVSCQRKACRYWINHLDKHNCVMLAAKNGPHTLQSIGGIYRLTRMRICQIEKGIFEKVRKISQ